MANEFLQEVFGSEALTFDQFSEKLGDRTLADLSTGEYVGKHKFDAMETKYNGANDLLAEAPSEARYTNNPYYIKKQELTPSHQTGSSAHTASPRYSWPP